MKMSHKSLILISGAVWMIVGCVLLPLGMQFLMEAIKESRFSSTNAYPLIGFLAPYLGGVEQTAIVLIVFGLLLGRLKGKKALTKAAQKGIARIRSFPDPVSLFRLYSKNYYLLLAGMMVLGLSLKYLGIASDIRGVIDIAVGAALIQGAAYYFRSAFLSPAS